MTRDDGYTRYTVRIPTPLYERVKEAAGEKSVNAEIVATLAEKYPAPRIGSGLLEAALADMFAADGWTVHLAHPDRCDLLIEKGNFQVAVEAKVRASLLRAEEVERLAAFVNEHRYDAAYVVGLGEFTEEAYASAADLNVILHDLTGDADLLASVVAKQDEFARSEEDQYLLSKVSPSHGVRIRRRPIKPASD